MIEVRLARHADVAWIEALYAEAGYGAGVGGAAAFQPAGADALPAFLSSRMASYLARGQDVIAMRRSPPGAA